MNRRRMLYKHLPRRPRMPHITRLLTRPLTPPSNGEELDVLAMKCIKEDSAVRLVYKGHETRVKYAVKETNFEQVVYLCDVCLTPYTNSTSVQHEQNCVAPKFEHEVYHRGNLKIYEIDSLVNGQNRFLENLRVLMRMYFYVWVINYSRTEELFYYVLVETDRKTGKITVIGFISLFKTTIGYPEEILILPGYQRRGFCTLLLELNAYCCILQQGKMSPNFLTPPARKAYDRYVKFTVLRTLSQHPDISVTELSSLTGVNKDTICAIASNLGFCCSSFGDGAISADLEGVLTALREYRGYPKLYFDRSRFTRRYMV